MAEGKGWSTAAENQAVVRRFYEEVFNQRREDVIPEIISPDYVDYGQPAGARSTGGTR